MHIHSAWYNFVYVQVKTVIPHSALLATASQRLQYLAKHKTYPPLLIKPHSEWEWGEWKSEISTAAVNAISTQHVCSLAEPKLTPKGYVGPRQVCWEVGKAAKIHLASSRTTKLARPKSKHEETEDYDPHTYTVSRSALIAQFSPRVNELAMPIPRKVSVKK